MSSNERTYTVGVSADGRPTITVDETNHDLPYNVWRDVGRLAGCSHNRKSETTFEFLIADNVPKAEKILHGALYRRA